ncbi:hypothetical protein ABH15_06430 [Methanoculleus taiwanensis]|uniref:BioF2-like acetyltransferase domain-containing protein n=1 Tax=Methanoculleus taiwanensis TaxID=1550565 RepID=A0A498GZQ7_9EURY|nr:GNAT family N-acetyltransferase [Methanoculleus taiwanensis]RXE55853.1 hypothetical protein ABH15_06430 [Methanoculleus taiwanensis]
MTYSIEALSEYNADGWEEFNRQCGEGTPFHSVRWKTILEDIFRLNLKYYLILDEQHIVGICPFIEQKTGFFRGLNTIPYSEYTQPILADTFDIRRINDLLSLFAKDYSFLHFTTYNPEIIDRIEYDNFPNENLGNMVVNLKHKPPDTLWQSTLSKDDRYKIRAFEKVEFEVQKIDHKRDIERFYHYYAENLNHINGEILPLSFFQKLIDSFSPEELRVALLTSEDSFAGGNLAILHPDQKTAYFEYLALNRNLPNKYSPSLYLYWEGVNWAWENGYEKVSFGRQRIDPNNRRFRYKVKFGADHIPILSRTVLLSKKASLLYRSKKMLTESRNI